MNLIDRVKNSEIAKQYISCFIGSILYTVSFNVFIIPQNLYSGGFFGIAQLFEIFISWAFNIKEYPFNLVGLIYFIFNFPLMFLLFKIMKKSFLYKTIFTLVFQTILFMFVPIPKVLIIEEKITSVIVGAMLTGIGLGMILRAASTSGGLDIVGIYFAKKSPTLSVGKIAIIVNTTIYILSALLFDLSTAIYSLIYSILTSAIMDYFHLQNRSSSAFIITKNTNINDSIITELKRGTTIMDGIGGYTKQGTKVILTAVSKYQKRHLNRIIQENDPNAFVIYSENCEVLGHFEKRFDE